MSAPPGARASRPPPSPKGWHARGYLPHFDSPETLQTVTFRLVDSLPSELYDAIAQTPANTELRAGVDASLDAGHGGCALRDPALAGVVAEAMAHFDGLRYRLLAWVVMPNHVHALFEPLDGFRLGEIVQSWKSFSAKAINRARGSSGRFWAPDYFDRYVRDEAHYQRVLHYIEQNPVKAGLVSRAEDWRFSSAHGARSAGVPPAL